MLPLLRGEACGEGNGSARGAVGVNLAYGCSKRFSSLWVSLLRSCERFLSPHPYPLPRGEGERAYPFGNSRISDFAPASGFSGPARMSIPAQRFCAAAENDAP